MFLNLNQVVKSLPSVNIVSIPGKTILNFWLNPKCLKEASTNNVTAKKKSNFQLSMVKPKPK